MKMMLQLHKLATKLWYGRSWWAVLLLPLAALFWLVSTLRRLGYTSGVWRRPELPVPVIVVGNINVGGTGKTPVVAWLAARLRAAGYQPAIVTRGYGGSYSGVPLVLTEATPVDVSGDEPFLLRKLTRCEVIVCADRVKAVLRAVEQGADIVIADDGLQHYRMRRAAEVIVVDGDRGFGNGWLLPAGPLREARGRLNAADVVLTNGASEIPDSIAFALPQTHAVRLGDGARKELSEFSGTVWGVAGIGNPERFYRALRARGLEVLETDIPDHGRIDIPMLSQQRKLPVLMTEKDATKYELEADADAWYVPVSVTLPEADADRVLAVLAAKTERWCQQRA